MPLQGSLSIERMCQLAGVSRAVFIVLCRSGRQWRKRCRRSRRFRNRRGASEALQVSADHGGVASSRDGGESQACVTRYWGKIICWRCSGGSSCATTDSDHRFPVHLNLARRMELTGIISCRFPTSPTFGCRTSFVYLAVVLDAFRARSGGMGAAAHAGRSIADRGAGTGHRRATTAARTGASLGSWREYACGGYAQVLQRHGIIASMSRPGNPYDNASCERF